MFPLLEYFPCGIKHQTENEKMPTRGEKKTKTENSPTVPVLASRMGLTPFWCMWNLCSTVPISGVRETRSPLIQSQAWGTLRVHSGLPFLSPSHPKKGGNREKGGTLTYPGTHADLLKWELPLC